jgi:glycine betaine/proline transport system substrate-binding protein
VLSYRPRPVVAGVGVVVLALTAGLLGAVGGAGDAPATAAGDGSDIGKGKKVTIGHVTWEEAVASTFVWKNVLEQRGFEVEVQQYDVAPLYTALGNGDIDFQTDAWLPTTSGPFVEKHAGKVENLGAWYGPTSLELAVPEYMDGIDTMEDLKGRADEFGGKITGIEPAAGEMELLKNKVLGAYGLENEYEVVDSSTPAMLAELKRAYAAKKPIVATLWSPHWAYNDFKLKKLKDTKGAWGKGDKIHTLARDGFSEENPVVAGWLRDFRMDEKQLTGLEADINAAGKGNQDKAVKAWLKKHPELVDRWAPLPKGAKSQGKGGGAETERPLEVAWFPWEEDIAITHLWKRVLEDHGYRMNLKQMDVGPVYTGLASGDIDLNFDAWLPHAQSNFWEKSKDDLVDLGSWYEPTSLEVSVPSYVKGITSMADLKGRADEFDGRIIGIEPGTGEMNLLKNDVLPAYGLEDEYEVVDGSTPAMLAELKRAYAEKKPVAVTLWSPHWAYEEYELTKLADPKKAWGEGNKIHTIASKDFPEQYPQLAKWIKGFRMSEEELASLEAEIVRRGQGKEQQAVDAWLKEHPDVPGRMTPTG